MQRRTIRYEYLLLLVNNARKKETKDENKDYTKYMNYIIKVLTSFNQQQQIIIQTSSAFPFVNNKRFMPCYAIFIKNYFTFANNFISIYVLYKLFENHLLIR